MKAADTSFQYGDMTSVTISEDGTCLAAALQAENYAANGRIALFDCNADGTLSLKKLYETGIQPDMITFTPDGSKLLTADEGEPREGYSTNSTDPQGTVTIVDLASDTVTKADFTAYDSEANRKQLTDAGIVLKKIPYRLSIWNRNILQRTIPLPTSHFRKQMPLLFWILTKKNLLVSTLQVLKITAKQLSILTKRIAATMPRPMIP